MFVAVVHRGKKTIFRWQSRNALRSILPELDARAEGKPVELFEAVLKAYAARKRASHKTVDLWFFCVDFAKEADALACHPDAGDREDQIRKLRVQRESVCMEISNAKTDAERARWERRRGELDTSIAKLTTNGHTTGVERAS